MNNHKQRTIKILGSAILAAAWLMAGPKLLTKWGVNGTANDLLVWIPAMTIYFVSILGDKSVYACEARAIKRLLGIKSCPK